MIRNRVSKEKNNGIATSAIHPVGIHHDRHQRYGTIALGMLASTLKGKTFVQGLFFICIAASCLHNTIQSIGFMKLKSMLDIDDPFLYMSYISERTDKPPIRLERYMYLILPGNTTSNETSTKILALQPRVISLVNATTVGRSSSLNRQFTVSDPINFIATPHNRIEPAEINHESANNAMILSQNGTIVLEEDAELRRHGETWFEWFEQCVPVTDPVPDKDNVNDEESIILSQNRVVTQIRPTCNNFHEQSISHDDTETATSDVELLNMKGSWRSVWKIYNSTRASLSDDNIIEGGTIVLKMLHMKREFDEYSYSIHQVDAMVMEILTASPYVASSYGFCGQSVMTAYAPLSAREIMSKRELRLITRLRLARDLARGLADLHTLTALPHDKMLQRKRIAERNKDMDQQIYLQEEKYPLIFAHQDINPANLIALNTEELQWNDFNLGVIARRSKLNNRPCVVPFHDSLPLWRAPEEIQNHTNHFFNTAGDAIQAADVYSLGNVLFRLLFRHDPWKDLRPDQEQVSKEEWKTKVAQAKVEGEVPTTLGPYMSNAKAKVMWEAIEECYEYNPADRPSALQLALMLGDAYESFAKRAVRVRRHQR